MPGSTGAEPSEPFRPRLINATKVRQWRIWASETDSIATS